MSPKRVIRRLAVAGALALQAAVWLGCGAVPEQTEPAAPASATEPGRTPERGDWLVRRLPNDPESLNPVTSSDVYSSAISGLIHARLLTMHNETLELVPWVARELPEISEDKLTYTFRLRTDATFADGTEVTAHDIVFSFKAVKNPEVMAPHIRNYINSVREVSAVDDHTVRFDLDTPYFKNDEVLGMYVEVLPRHHYDPDGDMEDISFSELSEFETLDPARAERARSFAKHFNEDFNRNPMGAGGFELRDIETDFVTGEKVVLSRREDYWGEGHSEYGDAWVEKIWFRIINKADAALVAFKGGDLDTMGLTPLQHTRGTSDARFRERADKDVHVSPGYSYIGWNQKRKLFQDVRVRRAMAYFVDKERIVEKIYLGFAVPVESSIFIGRPEYNHDLPAHVYDPERGKALLAEAGWVDTDGDGILDKEVDGERLALRFEIMGGAGSDLGKAVALTVVDEMKRAGIGASYRQLDWSIMLSRVKSFDYDATLMGWGMGVLPPDPYQLWHSSQAVPGASNHIFYRNAEVDRILEANRVEFDPGKRKQLMLEFQEIVSDEQPYTFLFMSKAIATWDRRFEDVTWYAHGSTDYGEWWVPGERQRYE